MKLLIDRIFKTATQVLGHSCILDEKNVLLFSCCTLELPDKNNKQQISCIPSGIYKCKKRYSTKFGWHFIIEGVPGREAILIHVVNYVKQLRGCIGVGSNFLYLDKDETIDLTRSRKTLDKMLSYLPETFLLTITDKTL